MDVTVDLVGQLAPLHARARAAWPTIDLAAEPYYAFVAERLADPDQLALLHTDDLYLVCAWLAGDREAHAALEAGPFREATAVLARFRAPGDAIDEAKQSARAILFARERGHAGLAAYTGRGALRSWLGVTLARELLQLQRRDQRRSPLDADELAGIADDGCDPETIYLRVRYGDALRRAVHDAVVALDPAAKRVLRYAVVERMTIDEVGALLGVHRSTAARQIAAARAELLATAHALMKARLALDSTELHSILRAVDGELDVSVQRLLQSS